jgi:head-tail adaptor
MRATASEISSQSFASDGGGGGSLTWTAGGTVDCRIAPLNGSEGERAERIAPHAEYIVTLPQSASVTTSSQLAIGGGTFAVAAVRDRSYEVTKRVEVVKVV